MANVATVEMLPVTRCGHREYPTQRAQEAQSQTVGQTAGIGLTRSSRGTRSWGAGSVSLGLCVSVLTMARGGGRRNIPCILCIPWLVRSARGASSVGFVASRADL